MARGSTLLREYAQRAGIAVEPTGALLVAWTEEQAGRLDAIAAKSRANGYTRIRSVPKSEVYQREPHLGPGAAGGLWVPDEWVIDPWSVPLAYATEAVRAGVDLRLGTRVTGVSVLPDGFELTAGPGAAPVRCRFAVNAAGLASDEVDRMFGGGGFTIRPRKGELIVYDKLARPLLSSIILPVPTARTKGVRGRAHRVRQRAARADRGRRRRTARTARRAPPGCRRCSPTGGGSCRGCGRRR